MTFENCYQAHETLGFLVPFRARSGARKRMRERETERERDTHREREREREPSSYTQKRPVYTQRSPIHTQKSPVYTQTSLSRTPKSPIPGQRDLVPPRLPQSHNTLQHTATTYNTLQHTATHCNTLQHTATHCNQANETGFLPAFLRARSGEACKFEFHDIGVLQFAFRHGPQRDAPV